MSVHVTIMGNSLSKMFSDDAFNKATEDVTNQMMADMDLLYRIVQNGTLTLLTPFTLTVTRERLSTIPLMPKLNSTEW